MLIPVALGMTFLVYEMNSGKLVALNLFYLPVVLAGFFLGRYVAGILAVFCVISTSLVCALQIQDFAAANPPLIVGLGVTLWGAVLCLTALLVGTLSDERAAQAVELHEAYVGVIEVLAKYLQSGKPQLNPTTGRVVALSHQVATEMRLSTKCIDDLRVAALMLGFSNIEITTKVISKAMHNLEDPGKAKAFSFHGSDLVQSLSGVLHGALPILLDQSMGLPAAVHEQTTGDAPIGARILRVVRAFVTLTDDSGGTKTAPAEVVATLRLEAARYDLDVLNALELVVLEPELITV